ncbi:MAG: bacillithiol biosynthesis BshC, partial [Chloroflexales bacterium]
MPAVQLDGEGGVNDGAGGEAGLPGARALRAPDGLAGADDARAFLPDPFDLETIRSRAALVRSRWRPASGRAAEPGLEELATGRRAVVTAGQQVGLFTGPLLTLAKAAAALSLVRELGRSGEEAGALFWCASEDHDLVEVTRVLLPGPDGPRDAGPDGGPLEANRVPVGGLPVPGGL